ncbi:MAG: (4Fe-4S)-binding protein, partial [Clostridiales bacterium]
MTISQEDIKRVKGLGFLHNRGTDNFSGRIITENGIINSRQLAIISQAAEKFAAGDIAFTSRMTIEVPGIAYDKIEAFRRFIAQENLQTGGTGAKVRPIVACKGTTCVFGLYDTQKLAQEIHQRFFVGYQDIKLPHKFKIAVGGCPNNCVKPNLNDLGIVGQLIPNFDEDSCNGCKKCSIVEKCPIGAATIENGILNINKDECNNCGRCVGACNFDS